MKTTYLEYKSPIDMKALQILLLMLACATARGQSFIEAIAESEFLSGSSQYALYEAKKNSGLFQSVTPVRIGDLWAYQENCRLAFASPKLGEVTAVASMVKSSPNGDYTWRGNIFDEHQNTVGYCRFIKQGSKKYGSISFGGKHFVIEDLNAELEDDQILIEIFESALMQTCGAVDEPLGPGDPHEDDGVGPDGPTDETPCPAKISVLFLYTQRVADEGYDVEQIANIGLEDLNEALRQSAIPRASVEVELASVELWSEYDDDRTVGRDILNLMRNNTTQVQAYRAEYKADLVMLVQATGIISSTAPDGISIGGWADLNRLAKSDRVFGVVNVRSAQFEPKLIGHEIGHLLGCGHLDSGHPFANAFLWNDENDGWRKYRTLMSATVSGVILRFSNPDNEFNGKATGAAANNNAQMIGDNACTIAGFGESLEGGTEHSPFHAFIAGPPYIYNDSYVDFTWSPLVYGCFGAGKSYLWQINWQGGQDHHYEFLSNSQTATLDGSTVPNDVPTVFVRLIATCLATGQLDTTIANLPNWSAQNFRQDDVIELRGSGQDGIQAGIKVFPNPASRSVTVQVGAGFADFSTVRLTNMLGEGIDVSNGAAMANGALTVDLSAAQSGMYMLSILSGKDLISVPIIITR